MTQVLPIELLHSGERGRICDVEGSPDLVHRLEEMGLHQGVTVQMVRSGSPCILAVNHHRLSFRGSDLANVLVEVAR